MFDAPLLQKVMKGELGPLVCPQSVWYPCSAEATSECFYEQCGCSVVAHGQNVEATVKPMKKLIKAAWSGRGMHDDKITLGLLQYRNMPSRKDGLSPAQKLFGHPSLPAHRTPFLPEWQRATAEVEQQATNTQEIVEVTYNQHARPLPMITVGSNMAVQNHNTKQWDIYGIVTEIGPHRRYLVKTQIGRVLARNRRFIRRRVPLAPTSAPTILPSETSPRAPRKSSRTHSKPNRLIEESKSFQVTTTMNSEAPGGGDVGI
jgi:hypothetical protein